MRDSGCVSRLSERLILVCQDSGIPHSSALACGWVCGVSCLLMAGDRLPMGPGLGGDPGLPPPGGWQSSESVSQTWGAYFYPLPAAILMNPDES